MSTMTGPRSLADTCLKMAIENVDFIAGIGGMPSHYIQAILNAVRTPARLRELEENSDDIYDETAVHWKRFINKEFRTLALRHNYVPKDPKSWHKVYDTYKIIQANEIAAATEKMKQEFAAHNEQKHSRTSKIISCQESNKLRPVKAKAGFAAPREKQTFIRKTAKQVRLEAARFNLSTPTGKLAVPPGQIKKAPQIGIQGAGSASQPGSLSIRRAPTMNGGELDREKMEARLLRAKTSAKLDDSGIPEHVLAFSDDEDDGLVDDLEVDGDDLFGDAEPTETVITSPVLAKAVYANPSAVIQSTKRPCSDEEIATEQPAKRRRAVNETGSSTSSSQKAVFRMPPAAVNPFGKPRRPKGLSASPGANNARRVQKAAPPQTQPKSNNPPSLQSL